MKRILLALFLVCLALVSCDKYTIIDNESSQQVSSNKEPDGYEYIINTSTKKYHTQICPYASNIEEENRICSTDIAFYTERGYSPCSSCILR